MANLSSASAAARARFARLSQRERGLLAGLAAAALVAAPWAANGWAEQRRADAAADLQQLQALQAGNDGVRLASAATRLRSLEERVHAWSAPAPSFAVARVLAEQDIAAAAAQAGLNHLDIHTDDEPQVHGGVNFVRTELVGDYSRPRMADALRRVASARPGILVERAATEGEGEAARLRLVLLAPVRLGSTG